MSMKKVLLVRSASYYQFEKNLAAINESFPGASITLIEHRSRLTEAQKFTDRLEKILVYPSEGPFSKGIPQEFEGGERFDDAVIQYANIDGEGYENINRFVLSLPANRLWSCNVDSEISPLTHLGFLSRELLGWGKAMLNVLWLLVLTPFFVIAAPFVYVFKIRKGP